MFCFHTFSFSLAFAIFFPFLTFSPSPANCLSCEGEKLCNKINISFVFSYNEFVHTNIALNFIILTELTRSSGSFGVKTKKFSLFQRKLCLMMRQGMNAAFNLILCSRK